MPLAQGNDKVKTLAADRAKQPFAKGVRLWRPHRRFDDGQAHRLQRAINTIGVDAVVVVYDKSVGRFARHDHAELLRRPVRRRMLGDVPVQNSPRSDLHDHEHVEKLEASRHGHKEVAGEHGACMISRERAPRLGTRAILRSGTGAHIRRTVRGETRIPSFTKSSEAIRSSPHMRLAAAISAINRRRLAGTCGRPGGLDSHRQNSPNPFRCHRINVSGLTTVRSWRHWIKRVSPTSASRIASSARRGLTCRSTYNANRLRRNRFSAANWVRGRNIDDANRMMSARTHAIVRTLSEERH